MNKKKFVFGTHEGSRLIGEIVDPTPDFLSMMAEQLPEPLFDVKQMARDGIWIKRERHLTYLSNDEIKYKKVATALDREDA